MHYYQFHIGDYVSHTIHLSLEEDLAYRRLLDMYYDSESPIPNNIPLVSRKLRMSADVVQTVLDEFFELSDEGYRNFRADSEISDYRKIIDKQKNNIDTKIITFQHRTFVDAYIINYIFGPVGYVFRSRFKDNIFIKNYIDKYGGVDVSTESNQGSSKRIVDYCRNSTNKLAIAPEDIIDYKKRIVSNNKLNVFRTGAFVPLLPIQPVVIKFYDKNPIWRNYSNGAESTPHWFLRRFLSPITYFDFYLLEECYPKINTTPKEYSDYVRDKMLQSIKDF
jgi:hypothetical protein